MGLGLEANDEKNTYMVMSRDQNAGQTNNIRTGNKIVENMEEFKYLGIILTNQNSVHEGKNNSIRTGNKIFEKMKQFKYLGTILTN
jgi:hypothetical protein